MKTSAKLLSGMLLLVAVFYSMGHYFSASTLENAMGIGLFAAASALLIWGLADLLKKIS